MAPSRTIVNERWRTGHVPARLQEVCPRDRQPGTGDGVARDGDPFSTMCALRVCHREVGSWTMSFTPVAWMKNVCGGPCVWKQSRQPLSEGRSGSVCWNSCRYACIPAGDAHKSHASTPGKRVTESFAFRLPLLPGVDVSISSPRCQMEKGVPRWVLS